MTQKPANETRRCSTIRSTIRSTSAAERVPLEPLKCSWRAYREVIGADSLAVVAPVDASAARNWSYKQAKQSVK